MSWRPVTYWTVGCDGRRGRDQGCEETWTYEDSDSDDGEMRQATFRDRELGQYDRSAARSAGWVIGSDGRALCPAHVAASETMLAAQLDGLPFDDVAESNLDAILAEVGEAVRVAGEADGDGDLALWGRDVDIVGDDATDDDGHGR